MPVSNVNALPTSVTPVGPALLAVESLSVSSLVDSEVRFRSAFQFAAIGMALVGLDGRWLKVNAALCDIVGYPEAELLRLSFQDITYCDDLATDLGHVQRLLQGEIDSYQMEKRYIRKDGRYIWILLTAALVRSATGQPLHFIAQVQDISPQKQDGADVLAAHDHLALVVEAQHIIATAGLDLDRVLALVAERAQSLTGADAAVVEMVDGPARDELIYRAASGAAVVHLGMRFRIDSSLSGLCVLTNAVQQCEDSESDPRVDAAACRRAGTRSMIVVPLRHLGEAVGVLKVASARTSAFVARDASTLELLASLIAAAFHNAAEFEAKQTLIAERTQALEAVLAAERELRARDARFRAAVTGMHDGFLVLCEIASPTENGIQDFTVVEMNESACEVLGLPTGALDIGSGRTLRALAPGAAQTSLLQIGHNVLATGERYNGEHRMRASNAASDAQTAVKWVRILAFPVEGEARTLAVIVRDITARKAAEAQLREEASRDSLTDLFNRRGLERVVAPALADTLEGDRPDVLLYIDLDGLKQINDTLGHAEGDLALQTVARLLRETMRAGDAIARLGGDEFVIYAPAGPAAVAGHDALMLKERVQAALQTDNHRARVDGRSYDIRASIGAVTVAPGETLEAILTRADRELYNEKREHRLHRKSEPNDGL